MFTLNSLRRGRLFLNRIPLGLTLLAALLSFGSYTFLYPLLERLPLFHSFRGSFKFFIFAQAFLALLSARGFQSWLGEEVSSKALSKYAFCFSFLFLLAAAWARNVPWLWSAKCLDSSAFAVFDFFVFGILGWPGKIPGKIALALLGMLNLCFAFGHLPSFDVPSYLAESQPLQAALAPSLTDGRVFWMAHNDRSMALSLSDIWGDDPLVPKRLSLLLASRTDSSASSTPDAQYLNLTPVKAALTRLAFLIDRVPGGFQPKTCPFPRLPQLMLVGGWKLCTNTKEGLDALSQDGFDPRKEVVLEETPDPLPVQNKGKGQIDLKTHNPDWLELTVEAGKPHILLMTDSYASGWKAEAYSDSAQKSYRVLPGDLFARAIPLSAGKHHFDLRYDPPAFKTGRAVTLAALLAYALAWGWVLQRKRRELKNK
jgi:hypothetical protein